MPMTLDAQRTPRNRIHHEDSGLTLEQRREIRDALLLVAGPLKCRPEPRDAWDALADGDKELLSLWVDKPVLMCRAALAAARLQGPDVYRVVKQRIEIFHFEQLRATLHGFEPKEAESLAAEIRDMTTEIADVVRAVAELSFDGSDQNLERVRAEGLEAINEITTVVDIASARLAHASP